MIWCIIKEFPNYSISDTGIVKNNKKGNVLKPYKDVWGYLRVDLCNNGLIQHKKIHRLVCEAFISNLNNLKQTNHKDENKLNNNVYNLEWCDCKYNLNYGNRRSIAAKNTCKKCFIKEINKKFNSLSECARYFNVSKNNIRRYLKNKNYTVIILNRG